MRLRQFFTILLACLVLTGCGKDGKTFKSMAIADDLGIQESSLLTFEDSHGGFHGDGDTIAVFQAPGFQPGADWKEFPLPENLSIVLYGGMIGDMEWLPFFTDDNGEHRMPQVETGFYYFRNRHSTSTDETDPSTLFDHGSINFTLAIYDTNSETVYYFEKDT